MFIKGGVSTMVKINKSMLKKYASPLVTFAVLAIAIMYIPHTGAYFFVTHFGQMSQVVEKYRVITDQDGINGFNQVYAQTINIK